MSCRSGTHRAPAGVAALASLSQFIETTVKHQADYWWQYKACQKKYGPGKCPYCCPSIGDRDVRYDWMVWELLMHKYFPGQGGRTWVGLYLADFWQPSELACIVFKRRWNLIHGGCRLTTWWFWLSISPMSNVSRSLLLRDSYFHFIFYNLTLQFDYVWECKFPRSLNYHSTQTRISLSPKAWGPWTCGGGL